MSTFVIALSDIIIDPINPVELSIIPQSQALQLIKKSYGFLYDAIEVTIDNSIATISLLLVFMYVGFKKIGPTMNTGFDFEDAYHIAQKLFTIDG